MVNTPTSAATGIHWPALPHPTNALLLALQYQLERSQWCTPEQLQQQQSLQLQALVTHAQNSVPFYQQRLQHFPNLNQSKFSLDIFRQIPILKRSELQQSNKNFRSSALPKDHLPIHQLRTSGSTGAPVDIIGTQVTELFFRAFNLRNHLWHQRNFSGKLAIIQIQTDREYKQKARSLNWVEAFPSGQVVEFDTGQTIQQQLLWIQQEQPDYLLTYPSNLKALIEQAQTQGNSLSSLQGISTFGELVTPTLRQLVRESLKLEIIDVYSAKDAGIIALQCPKDFHYHIQSEGIYVEILDNENQPCASGEVGRVVVTPLHNYAMPLLRYEIGDYAEVGHACPCGRGLPVLNQIYGRQRNMLVLPTGEKIWPKFILSNWAKMGPIRQIQAIQQNRSQIEVKLVIDRPLIDIEEKQLHQKISEDFDNKFQILLQYVDEIPRTSGGKYEDFICEVS
jgi:phenylacetate-CoA ligase